MTGIICLWYGAIVDIPAGWTLCDGTAGTPDLRNRLIIGAGGGWFPHMTGGSLTHFHITGTHGHMHRIYALIGAYIAGAGHANSTGWRVDSLTMSTESHLPPYKSLSWIMRV